jgi:photosystem II stability/assembly factor-like uncharacterized protein
MKDTNSGWAIAAAKDDGDHILHTLDGGQTWADVTPLEPAPISGEPRKIATVFFLDVDSAWVTYSFDKYTPPDYYPIVWYTQDGGVSWQPSAYLDTRSEYSPRFMDFIDPQNGWLLVAIGNGMSRSYSLLFRTIDGGATWARIIDPQSSPDLHFCCKTGMDFKDAQTGMVASDQGPFVEPYVIWTRDGGLTWLRQFLPDPVLAGCKTHSPHFFDTNAVLVGLSCWIYNDSDQKINYNFVYTTFDDGDTWMTSPADGTGKLFFFDEYTGFIFGRDIYFTEDGGLTWEFVKTVFWDGQFSFINRDIGWAVARNGDEIAFMTTINGGKTWQEIEPVIGP